VSRFAPLVLVALVVAGCGASKPVVAPLPAPPKAKPVRIVAKTKFVRRVNAICARLDGPKGAVGDVPTMTSDVIHNRVVFGAYIGRAHRVIRTARREMVRLGQPSRDRARWARAMSKLTAIENHLDVLRAAVWAGSVDMVVLSARELKGSAKSADRRFRRFGAGRCSD
jgi:hypothetical protein